MLEDEPRRKRRRYGPKLKAQIMAECEAFGTPMVKVASLHGIITKIVHGRHKLARHGDVAARKVLRQFEFVPLAIAPKTQNQSADERIEVELWLSALTITIAWPTSAAANLAACTCEPLR